MYHLQRVANALWENCQRDIKYALELLPEVCNWTAFRNIYNVHARGKHSEKQTITFEKKLTVLKYPI
jgi:hypothetical protein